MIFEVPIQDPILSFFDFSKLMIGTWSNQLARIWTSDLYVHNASIDRFTNGAISTPVGQVYCKTFVPWGRPQWRRVRNAALPLPNRKMELDFKGWNVHLPTYLPTYLPSLFTSCCEPNLTSLIQFIFFLSKWLNFAKKPFIARIDENFFETAKSRSLKNRKKLGNSWKHLILLSLIHFVPFQDHVATYSHNFYNFTIF